VGTPLWPALVVHHALYRFKQGLARAKTWPKQQEPGGSKALEGDAPCSKRPHACNSSRRVSDEHGGCFHSGLPVVSTNPPSDDRSFHRASSIWVIANQPRGQRAPRAGQRGASSNVSSYTACAIPHSCSVESVGKRRKSFIICRPMTHCNFA
jgi:hypothetical protein